MAPHRVILAVDGNSLVHRSFHALASTGMRAADGSPIWAVRGLLTQLVAAVERIGPDTVVVGFDDPTNSIRRDRWAQYKATRADKLFSLVEQLARAAAVLTDLGIGVVIPDGLEADDVLASVALQARDANARTVVMTSDRDSFALIDENTSVLRIINGGVEASPLLTPERLVTMLGVAPAQYRDFAALRGDPSDNLPGVRGVGPKTAAKLLAALGSAHAAFEDMAAGGRRVIDAIGAAAAARLAEPQARAAWELNCQVMTFHTDVSIDLSPAANFGGLPLAEPAVRSTFTDHQLPATLPVALRCLAGADVAEMAAEIASTPAYTSTFYRGTASTGSNGWRGQRYGRLPRRNPEPEPITPKAEQLSLFG